MTILFHRWMDSVNITLLETGRGDIAIDGYVNAKTVPFAILGEATRGWYEFTRDGTTVRCEPGTVIFAPPQTPVRLCHRHDPVARTMDYRFIHVRFVVWGGVDVFELIRPPMTLSGATAEELGDAMDRLLAAGEAGAPAVESLARRQAIGFDVLRILATQSEIRPHADQLIEGGTPLIPLLKLLHEDFASPWDVERMTRIARLSRANLYRRFIGALGVAPMHYLKRLRLDEGASRLMRSKASVGEVAEHVGFADISHFSREFTRRFGAAPSVYRRARVFGDLRTDEDPVVGRRG
jgi:AraC-like DNA-binding protein